MSKRLGFNFEQTYKTLPDLFYSEQMPTKVEDPKLVLFNGNLAEQLGLQVAILKENEGTAVFAGNEQIEGSEPIAQAYAGHQFGHFTMLGDGRAILLGEHRTNEGKLIDIQLKGAGVTPYSRAGDGRAGLGPMLREYIISEAMHELGVPTTRSLAVVTTGEQVIREQFLEGAILTRVASSHLRVGTFQYARALQNIDHLRELADYAIQRHDEQLLDHDDRYFLFLRTVAKRQAQLIAKWQLVGFIHGVMNTDNMTISGETIDYGPCAFIDVYHQDTVFSSIDHHGRYSYKNQPPIGAWNIARFAETLLPLIDKDEKKAVERAQTVIHEYHEQYDSYWLDGMRKKLGLHKTEDDDLKLMNELLQLMEEAEADYTNTFLELTYDERKSDFLKGESFQKWEQAWIARLEREGVQREEILQRMKLANPALIPRNHFVEEALEAAVEDGDYEPIHTLLHALKNPYEHRPEQKKYAITPPKPLIAYRTFCGT